MNLAQNDDYAPGGYFDLVSEPGPELVEYQDTYPVVGATPSILDQIVSFGQKIVPAVLSYQQQRDLNAINIERARRGLSPLNTSAYVAQSAPQVRFGMTADTQKMLMYGVLIAAVAGVLIAFARPSRR